MTNDDIKQVTGIYHRRIGNVVVTAISDGYIDAPYSVLQSISPVDAQTILTEEFKPTPPRISVNCYVIQADDKIAVVDTGSGDSMGPTLGLLAKSLMEINIDLKQIFDTEKVGNPISDIADSYFIQKVGYENIESKQKS